MKSIATVGKKITAELSLLFHDFFDSVRPFGFKVALYKAICRITDRIIKTPIGEFFSKRRHQAILQCLNKKFAKEIEAIVADIANNRPEKAPQPTIWQSWWQGEDSMCELTRMCTNSIKKHSGGYRVLLITKENYQEYVSIPSHIIEKLNRNVINKVEFSDILRVHLLCQNGGLWLDATVLLTKDLTADQVEASYYTFKNACADLRNVTEYRWAIFCLGGNKNHPLFSFMSKMYDAYWEKEDRSIDYFLVDYLVALAYEHIPAVRSEIDAFPHNNPMLHQMVDCLSSTYSDELMEALTKETSIFKLSRHKMFPKRNVCGEKTLYDYILSTYGKNG